MRPSFSLTPCDADKPDSTLLSISPIVRSTCKTVFCSLLEGPGSSYANENLSKEPASMRAQKRVSSSTIEGASLKRWTYQKRAEQTPVWCRRLKSTRQQKCGTLQHGMIRRYVFSLWTARINPSWSSGPCRKVRQDLKRLRRGKCA